MLTLPLALVIIWTIKVSIQRGIIPGLFYLLGMIALTLSQATLPWWVIIPLAIWLGIIVGRHPRKDGKEGWLL